MISKTNERVTITIPQEKAAELRIAAIKSKMRLSDIVLQAIERQHDQQGKTN